MNKEVEEVKSVDLRELKKKGKTPSRAQIMCKIKVKTRVAHDTLADYLEKGDNAYFLCTVILRSRGHDEQASLYKELIDNMFKEGFKELDERIEQLEAIVASDGLEDVDVEYTSPEELKLPVSTPCGRKIIKLCEKADIFNELISNLWINGSFDDTQYQQATKEVRSKIRRVCGRLISYGNKAREYKGTEAAPEEKNQVEKENATVSEVGAGNE